MRTAKLQRQEGNGKRSATVHVPNAQGLREYKYWSFSAAFRVAQYVFLICSG
jgi:hypothetical protein